MGVGLGCFLLLLFCFCLFFLASTSNIMSVATIPAKETAGLFPSAETFQLLFTISTLFSVANKRTK